MHEVWYEGKKADGRLMRVLREDGEIEVKEDVRWGEKERLIEAMMGIRRELAESL